LRKSIWEDRWIRGITPAYEIVFGFATLR